MIQSPDHAKILAGVTAHYVEARLPWLKRVLLEFAQYPFPVDVVIFTNDIRHVEVERVLAIIPEGISAEIRVQKHLDHPFALAWSHKRSILDDFIGSGYTHYIYVEDDILIRADAFAYWRWAREGLKSRNVVPGFVRVERKTDAGPWYATDQFGTTYIEFVRTFEWSGLGFTNLNSPYVGSFVLDQALAIEYSASRSFAEGASLAVKPNWGTRERAAMGVSFEGVPRFFGSRLVVPFDRVTLQVPDFAYIVHAPATYVSDPESELGKLPVSALLTRQPIRTQVGHLVGRAWGKLAAK